MARPTGPVESARLSNSGRSSVCLGRLDSIDSPCISGCNTLGNFVCDGHPPFINRHSRHTDSSSHNRRTDTDRHPSCPGNLLRGRGPRAAGQGSGHPQALRRAVLIAACSGRLTEDWRSGNDSGHHSGVAPATGQRAFGISRRNPRQNYGRFPLRGHGLVSKVWLTASGAARPLSRRSNRVPGRFSVRVVFALAGSIWRTSGFSLP